MSTGHSLPLAGYRDQIALDLPFVPPADPAAPEAFDELTRDLLVALSADPAAARLGITADQVRAAAGTGQRRALLRALLTVRAPDPLPPTAEPLLDALLAGERAQRPSVDATALDPVIRQQPATRHPAAATTAVWRGDITTLSVDAIVNAANPGLLGCFQPAHRCVDNVVHAAAGPRLRADCHTVRTAQNNPEPTGTAKITRGYHLPARYVLHTVGPVVEHAVTAHHEAALTAAYLSCLDLAAAVDDIRSVAFCSISTGLFGFPKPAAARVALTAVATWLTEHPGRLDRIVFDVYDTADLQIYQQAFATWEQPS
ncbi:protein-ADP-ribose hydrolase [Actinoplanes sp. N902-109]|uniref:protein-ADP-ribose hydrolase n=1 Tax=Actinoplanes sp. (strain N902-109) TaxID=649831 RepID=UPI0003294B00|nr:protein-ADP-ribose hydrolase [Actinoplanes sp. N902-109]AGL14583.1 appr-1-p processing enzyme family domain protein [Actinoplanes sp. N902-109]